MRMKFRAGGTARTRQSDKVDPISRAAHDSRPAPRLVPQFRLGYPLVFCERERPVLPPRGPRGLAISERNFLRSAHYMSGIDFTAATRPRAPSCPGIDSRRHAERRPRLAGSRGPLRSVKRCSPTASQASAEFPAGRGSRSLGARTCSRAAARARDGPNSN